MYHLPHWHLKAIRGVPYTGGPYTGGLPARKRILELIELVEGGA
jgi:hypothetical protein